jgi:hypothetical protein
VAAESFWKYSHVADLAAQILSRGKKFDGRDTGAQGARAPPLFLLDYY